MKWAHIKGHNLVLKDVTKNHRGGIVAFFDYTKMALSSYKMRRRNLYEQIRGSHRLHVVRKMPENVVANV